MSTYQTQSMRSPWDGGSARLVAPPCRGDITLNDCDERQRSEVRFSPVVKFKEGLTWVFLVFLRFMVWGRRTIYLRGSALSSRVEALLCEPQKGERAATFFLGKLLKWFNHLLAWCTEDWLKLNNLWREGNKECSTTVDVLRDKQFGFWTTRLKINS